jgi:YhcH/YjgK/YiaL family protein
MKKSVRANLVILFFVTFLLNGSLVAQTSNDKKMSKIKAKEWADSRVWANGLTLKLHESADVQEFAFQYQKNKSFWDAAFDYLKNTDLETLAPGRYNILEDNVYVIVSEGAPKTLADAKWESHKNFIDIQYVIQGKETMGLAPISKASILEEYNDIKDVAFHSVSEEDGKYFIAGPGTFLIFFTKDAHRPGIKVEGCDKVKKAVIKIRTAE